MKEKITSLLDDVEDMRKGHNEKHDEIMKIGECVDVKDQMIEEYRMEIYTLKEDIMNKE